MKNIDKLLYLILVLFASSLLSCESTENLNEWDMTYISLLPADYLKPMPSFQLKHVEDIGIQGDLYFEFIVRTQRPVDKDISVNVRVVSESISNDNIELSSKTIVIKANEFDSEVISVRVANWSDLLDVKDELSFSLNIELISIESESKNLKISDIRNTIPLKINKSKERKRELVWFTDASQWTFTFMEGVENASSNSVAGTGTKDVATNGVPYWFTVDFEEVKTISAIRIRAWGAAYTPFKIEVFKSDNNGDWVSLGVYDNRTQIQLISFEDSVETRYIKYQMINVPPRVSLVKFDILAYE